LRVPTEDEVLLLFEESAPWFRPAVILGAGLGLRQGEAAGLTVDRIDFLRRTVTIDRQWSTPPSGPAGFAPPKTESSVRVIPAADVVLQALARHLELHGAGLHDVILHGRDGRPVNRTPFGRAWNATLQRAGIDDVRHHDLRHHYVSRAIASGCSVKAVQLALGHRSATTTLDVYGHLWPGDEDRLRAASEGLTFSAEDSLRTGAPLRPR
jgi:integrase